MSSYPTTNDDELSGKLYISGGYLMLSYTTSDGRCRIKAITYLFPADRPKDC